ncbi:Signal transduction response regulator, receiver domain [Sesbania bispinosa]|nr:Signal transduction response regulator, receiver domain [Sesbania bispinosa]
MDDPIDQFPIGMRVLAVDDDPTCLMVLETLLRRCQYNVTATKNAISALKLLRENKNRFDLVISDVHMPDMDGFKLLELVGLEMDLPVIMLSVNDDPKMVMKGITHGACDYLLKPVRIEELQNIWQHVIRRKKIDLKELNKTSNEDTLNSEAVPKKILDLMNVEKLTRENKYRLYLKRISCEANQQANMVAALGGADTSYLGMSSLSGVRHLHSLSGSRQYDNNPFRPFAPGGMMSRLNTPASLNLPGLSSSGSLQLGHAQNVNKNTNDQLKFQSAIAHGNQSGGQGRPISVGLDQLQHNKGVSPILLDQKTKVTMGFSPSVLNISNNGLVLEANPQDKQVGGVYENSTSAASQLSQFSVLDNDRCNDIWSSAIQTSETNSYLPSEYFGQPSMLPTDMMTSVPLQGGNSSGPLQGGNLSAVSSITPLSTQPHTLTNMHSQGVNFTIVPEQVNSNLPFQGWDNNNQDGSYHSQVIGSPIGSLITVNGAADPEGHTPINSTFNRNLDFDFCDPLQMKHDGIIELTEETSLKPNQHMMNLQKSQNSRIISNNLGSLEDLVTTMMKQ